MIPYLNGTSSISSLRSLVPLKNFFTDLELLLDWEFPCTKLIQFQITWLSLLKTI
jgi:hypothetical protein